MYGIPQEYLDSHIFKRIIAKTEDIKQLSIPSSDNIIKFAASFTVKNINLGTFADWSYPDLGCAELLIKCFTQTIKCGQKSKKPG